MDWYRKLLSLYRDEEDRLEDGLTTDDHQNIDLQTRVTYQYPKFPHRKATDYQEYKENRNSSEVGHGISNIYELLNKRSVENQSQINTSKGKDEIRTEQVEHNVTYNKEKPQSKGKIPTESDHKKKTPFQPTEIPSPIFGFQRKRKQNDIIEFELTSFELEYGTKSNVYLQENNIKENNTYINENKEIARNESNTSQVEPDLVQEEMNELDESEHILIHDEENGLDNSEYDLAQAEMNELDKNEKNIAHNGLQINGNSLTQEKYSEENVEEVTAAPEEQDELVINSSTEIKQLEGETEESIELDENIVTDSEEKNLQVDVDTDKNEETKQLIHSQDIEKERINEVEQTDRPRTPKRHLPFNVIMLKKDRELLKKRNEKRASAEKDRFSEDLNKNKEEKLQENPALDMDNIDTNNKSSSQTLSKLLARASMDEREDEHIDNNVKVVDEKDAEIKSIIEINSNSQMKVTPSNDDYTSTVEDLFHVEKQIAATSTRNNEYETYEFPSREFLKKTTTEQLSEEWIEDQKAILNNTLRSFHVGAKVVDVSVGPTVTRFELSPDMGVKVSKITNLTDDLKLSLAAKDIRIEAPIPGKHTIGIEVPNKVSRPVFLRDIINEPTFNDANSPLTAALGLDIAGKPVITDIKKMPHGLIAGATGSGKSVCINTFIISLLYRAKPDEVKLLLIDPKMVELSPYNGIPHLISPVITDIKAATQALKWAVDEMERRYELFAHAGVRDIGKFNEKCDIQEQKLPYIVIVIDELADLMMMAPNDVEEAIARIAQKARACGIHLLIATQRPSVDVITGLIKANVPTRIAFSVSSQIDSRTIIDISGAERLLGKGDMLFIENGTAKPFRVQGAFISDEEIEKVVDHVRMQGEPNYLFEQEELIRKSDFAENDELLYEACEFAYEQGNISTSSLQRHFRIGYNRAARIIELMEGKGMISEAKGSKPRDVLMTNEDLQQLKEFL